MCTNCSKTIEAELYFFNKEYQPKLSVCKYYQYNLPIIREEDPIKSVYTREHPPDEGIKFADLFSHRLHGVDNTGNVKVWEAESVLAYILLTQPEYYQDFNDK